MIKGALPLEVARYPQAATLLLDKTITGEAQMWIMTGMRGEERAILGGLLTTFTPDVLGLSKRLVIYAMMTFTPMRDSEWQHGKDVLLEFAKARKCDQVVAYTRVSQVGTLAVKLGADIQDTILGWEVK